MTESCIRMWNKLFRSPAVRARSSLPPTFDLAAFANQGGVTIIAGEHGLEDELALIATTEFQEMVDLAKARAVIPGLFVMDEAFNAGLIPPLEVRALATLRAFGMSIAILIQNYPHDPDLLTGLLQNTGMKFLFRMEDPRSSDISADLVRPVLDPFKQHHTTTKSVNFGMRPEHRTSTSKTKGERGESETTSEAIHCLPDIKLVDEIHYDSLSDQLTMIASNFQSKRVMTPGTCYAIGGVYGLQQIRVDLVPDRWYLPGLFEKKLPQCYEINDQRPEMVTPPSPETQTSSSAGSGKRGRSTGSPTRSQPAPGKSSSPRSTTSSGFRPKGEQADS